MGELAGDLALIAVVGLITFAARASYLGRGTRAKGEDLPPFLDVFPVALFVALATIGLAAPDGDLTVGPSLGAAVGGVIGAVVTRRSIIGVVVFGAAGYGLAASL